MITTDFLSALNRFSLIISKRVTSKYSGTRPSAFTGRGQTISDHRMYAWGDDFRLINWRIYARTDDLYVKKYEEEKNMIVHVIIDSSASMNYGKIKKFDYAAMIGVGFAYLAMKSNEKFRFATFSNKLEIFQPKRGPSHLAAMVEYLNAIKPAGTSNLLDAVKKYRGAIGTKALIILLSDFLYEPREIEEALHLFGEHDMKVVQIVAETEKNLAIEGDINLHDSESKDTMHTFVSPQLRTTYLKMLDEHAAKIKKVCLGIKADFYQITTDTPIFDAFYQMLK